MEKIEVPYPQDEFNSFQALDIYKHCHHPAVQEEFTLEIDTLKFSMQLGQHPRKQFVKKVHSPFDLS